MPPNGASVPLALRLRGVSRSAVTLMSFGATDRPKSAGD
jgi:hypothetical protein